MTKENRWDLCADDYIDSLIENGEGTQEGFAVKALRILLNPSYFKVLVNENK